MRGVVDRQHFEANLLSSSYSLDLASTLVKHDRADIKSVIGITKLSNKKCAHALTHECPFLADSNSSLCTPCALAAENGQSCS